MKIKCRRRSEIVLSRINLCNDRAMMLKKEKQAILTRTEYLQNPCRTSAIPFWKCFDYELPAGVEVIHEEEIGKIDIDKRRQAVRYFRLFHRLDWMPSCIQSKAELLIAPRQTADFAAMINAAYADLQVSEAQLLQLQKQAIKQKQWLLYILTGSHCSFFALPYPKLFRNSLVFLKFFFAYRVTNRLFYVIILFLVRHMPQFFA